MKNWGQFSENRNAKNKCNKAKAISAELFELNLKFLL